MPTDYYLSPRQIQLIRDFNFTFLGNYPHFDHKPFRLATSDCLLAGVSEHETKREEGVQVWSQFVQPLQKITQPHALSLSLALSIQSIFRFLLVPLGIGLDVCRRQWTGAIIEACDTFARAQIIGFAKYPLTEWFTPFFVKYTRWIRKFWFAADGDHKMLFLVWGSLCSYWLKLFINERCL